MIDNKNISIGIFSNFIGLDLPSKTDLCDLGNLHGGVRPGVWQIGTISHDSVLRNARRL